MEEPNRWAAEAAPEGAFNTHVLDNIRSDFHFPNDDTPNEGDHCRICRGDGTDEEPLFYPCKCNGSIRYVHQSCLMQWLSRTQKKHCELCKTPFRFTKLYDAHMPTTVPWPIFVKQAALHILRLLLKCARWVLVLFVWLAWVPWCMRAVWRGLFWVGDGSWITQQSLSRAAKIANATATIISQSTIVPSRLSVAPMIPSFWDTVHNLTNGEPVFSWFGRRLLNTIIFPYSILANTTMEVSWVDGPPRRSSILSEVRFLKAPTRWRLVNETILDILEGQLITVLILGTFILIFLIREWVVQQQPMINLGQALEVQAAEQPEQPAVIDRHNEDREQAQAPSAEQAATENQQDQLHQHQHQDRANIVESIEDQLRTHGQARLELLEETAHHSDSVAALDLGDVSNRLAPDNDDASKSLPLEPRRPLVEDSRDNSTNENSSTIAAPPRPTMPNREVVPRASDIARTLEELNLSPASSHGDDTDIDFANQKSSTTKQSALDEATGTELSQSDSASSIVNDTAPSQAQGEAMLTPQPGPILNYSDPTWTWETVSTDNNDSENITNNPKIIADAAHSPEDGTENDLVNNEIETIEVPAVANNEEIIDVQLADDQPAGVAQDPEVLRAAAEAGIDLNEVEPVEDGEDMDGVMELIGMQGPLVGLLQNGMFSTVIISTTLLFAVWIPYLIGKMVLIVLANPVSFLIKMPLRWTATIADIIVDIFIFTTGCVYHWLDQFVRLTTIPILWLLPFSKTAKLDDTIAKTAQSWTWSAADRLVKNMAISGGVLLDSDIPVFSIVAHESLETLQNITHKAFATIFSGFGNVSGNVPSYIHVVSHLSRVGYAIADILLRVPKYVQDISLHSLAIKPGLNMLKINLDVTPRTTPLQVSPWSASDRAIAIILGYAFLATLGSCYLKVRKHIKELIEAEKPVDGFVVDILNQAGGVFKVILIIAIEMLAFPLYCGFLLDVALLPLFSNATLASRVTFVNESPWTAIFIHWFAGTCYMFHFALFVAMCRKILRTGVLYFIRDPDDPSFHPIRDVLERNIATQLRKILSSALVYGALVIVCLGAVVWTIATLFQNIFPIHWSSNEPVLEFPADLLVYNFLMPLAVRVFKPSTGLQDMYNWWFRKCARLLRLSHFLFNERNEDEQGYTIWKKVASNEEIEVAKARDDFKWPIIRDGQLSWQTLSTRDEKPESKELLGRDAQNEQDPPAGYKKAFIYDGRLVRAPASDQVRIPKGIETFVDIDPVTGHRKDGQPENPQGLHGKDNKMFANIYIPPWFPMRIGTFFVLIWAFAAFTGVAFTVIPLVVGRFVFSRLIQSGPRMNDVYAFAIGFYLLAAPIWLSIKYRPQLSTWMDFVQSESWLTKERIKANLPRFFSLAAQSIRLTYFYGAFGVLLPAMLGLLWEAYVLIPLHTYFERTENTIPQHTVHFVSDWTLGVLFMRVIVHIALKYPDNPMTIEMVALVVPENNGSSWLKPDIRMATRLFILPFTAALACALLVPPGLSRLLIKSVFEGLGEQTTTIVYRYSYPVFLALICAFALLKALWRGINRWRARIRDEVYLIGERLHNYEDKREKVSA